MSCLPSILLRGLYNIGRKACAVSKVLLPPGRHKHDRSDSGSGRAGRCRRVPWQKARTGRGFPLGVCSRTGVRWVLGRSGVWSGFASISFGCAGSFCAGYAIFVAEAGFRLGEGGGRKEEDVCAKDDDEYWALSDDGDLPVRPIHLLLSRTEPPHSCLFPFSRSIVCTPSSLSSPSRCICTNHSCSPQYRRCSMPMESRRSRCDASLFVFFFLNPRSSTFPSPSLVKLCPYPPLSTLSVITRSDALS